jgi:hypothetical protein
MDKPTYTLEEARKLLRIGKNQMRAAVRLNQVPTIQLGKRLFVPKAALDRIVAGEGGIA